MHVRPTTATAFVALLLALSLAGCTEPTDDVATPGTARPASSGRPVATASPAVTPEPPSSPVTDDDAPVLQVAQAVGFDPFATMLPVLPALTVYADGTVIGAPPVTSEGGPPASAALVTTTLDRAQVDDLVAAASAAHLLQDVDYGAPDDDDLGVLTLTLTVDGATYVHRVSTLYSPSDPGEPPTPEEARLLGFIEDVAAPLGPVDGDVYRPTAYAVVATFAMLGRPTDEDAPATPLATWPLDQPLAGFATCGVVEGADAAALEDSLAAAEGASGLWVDEDVPYLGSVRPLLPHEGSDVCPAV